MPRRKRLALDGAAEGPAAEGPRKRQRLRHNTAIQSASGQDGVFTSELINRRRQSLRSSGLETEAKSAGGGHERDKWDEWDDDPFYVQTWDEYRSYVNLHTALAIMPDLVMEIIFDFCRRRQHEVLEIRTQLMKTIRDEFGLANLSTSCSWADGPNESQIMQLERLRDVLRQYSESIRGRGHAHGHGHGCASGDLASLAKMPSHVLVDAARNNDTFNPSRRSYGRRSGWMIDFTKTHHHKPTTYVVIRATRLPAFSRSLAQFSEDFYEMSSGCRDWGKQQELVLRLQPKICDLFQVWRLRDFSARSIASSSDNQIWYPWAKGLFQRWLRESSAVKRKGQDAMFNLSRLPYITLVLSDESHPDKPSNSSTSSKSSNSFTSSNSNAAKSSESNKLNNSSAGNAVLAEETAAKSSKSSKSNKLNNSSAGNAALQVVEESDDDGRPIRFDGVWCVVVTRDATARQLATFLREHHDKLQRVSSESVTLYHKLSRSTRQMLACIPNLVASEKQFAWWLRTPLVQEVIDAYERIVSSAETINRHLSFRAETNIWIRPATEGKTKPLVPLPESESESESESDTALHGVGMRCGAEPSGVRLVGDVLQVSAAVEVDTLIVRILHLCPHLSAAQPP